MYILYFAHYIIISKISIITPVCFIPTHPPSTHLQPVVATDEVKSAPSTVAVSILPSSRADARSSGAPLGSSAAVATSDTAGDDQIESDMRLAMQLSLQVNLRCCFYLLTCDLVCMHATPQIILTI